MIRASKNRILASVLAAAGMFGLPAGAPVNNAPSVAQQQARGADANTPPVAAVATPQMQAMLPTSFGRFFRYREPVWLGKQKRGNRRNRSRFNYNR